MRCPEHDLPLGTAYSFPFLFNAKCKTLFILSNININWCLQPLHIVSSVVSKNKIFKSLTGTSFLFLLLLFVGKKTKWKKPLLCLRIQIIFFFFLQQSWCWQRCRNKWQNIIAQWAVTIAVNLDKGDAFGFNNFIQRWAEMFACLVLAFSLNSC